MDRALTNMPEVGIIYLSASAFLTERGARAMDRALTTLPEVRVPLLIG